MLGPQGTMGAAVPQGTMGIVVHLASQSHHVPRGMLGVYSLQLTQVSYGKCSLMHAEGSQHAPGHAGSGGPVNWLPTTPWEMKFGARGGGPACRGAFWEL